MKRETLVCSFCNVLCPSPADAVYVQTIEFSTQVVCFIACDLCEEALGRIERELGGLSTPIFATLSELFHQDVDDPRPLSDLVLERVRSWPQGPGELVLGRKRRTVTPHKELN